MPMGEREQTLVTLLAATDAVFEPVRDFGDNWNRNAYLARRRFTPHGVPWGSGGKTEADRKAGQRALHALAEEGLATTAQPQRVKTLFAKLTDAGEALGRRLCGLSGLCCGWATLAEVARLARRRRQPWVCELELAGLKDYRQRRGEATLVRELVMVLEMALPAMVRGWVGARADLQRSVSYAVSESGWALLGRGDPAPPEDHGEAGAVDEECRSLYYARLSATVAALRTATPVDSREIGPCPLPVSM
jgi:hypothetical protein